MAEGSVQRPGSTAFSRELARLLTRRGLSWRKLAELVGYTPSWLSKVKNGAPPSADLARRCDEVLEAGGKLAALAVADLETTVLPAQLPAVTAGFSGRSEQLRALHAALSAPEQVGAPLVVTIDGPPGAGKTTLALRWAHEVAALFPDGQLYANLRGYSGAQCPLGADEVLEEFLSTLGMPADRIPSGLGRRAGLYRSLLAGRRVLVVLDNAAQVAQLEPLLPGSAGCVVVVTSRSPLPGLGVRVHTRRVTVRSMPPEESFALLRNVIGPERVNEEPEAVRALARHCAHLPLALRIAAERVLSRPPGGVAEVVDQLATTGLDLLAIDDATAVRGVFSWSYRALDDESARMFRVLSSHPGPQFGVAAAAALAGVPQGQARRLIEALADVHLLESLGDGRYRLHDLLRLYAAERARAEDSDTDRRQVVCGLTEWYVRSAAAAALQIAPYRAPLPTLFDLLEGADPEVFFEDAATALRWCESEMYNVVPVIQQAVEHGMPELAWKLAVLLYDYFLFRKAWSTWLAVDEVALRAARAAGDRRAEGWVYANLAAFHFWRRDFDLSETEFEQALAVATEVGDPHGQAWAFYGLACLSCERNQNTRAREYAEQALALFDRLGEQDGEAATLATMGDVYRQTGQSDTAIRTTQRALRACVKLHNRYGQGRKLAKLAEVHRARGERERALHYLDLSLRVRREADDRWGVADSHVRRGDILHELGKVEAARAEWQNALDFYTTIDDPRVVDMRERLGIAGSPRPAPVFPGTVH